MSSNSIPTMAGFGWSPIAPYVAMEVGEDGWCVRNAVCKLLGWERDSEEWGRFVEGPKGMDLIRLAIHLGLTVFEVGAPGVGTELSHRAAHPGAALFAFPKSGRSHTEYVPDVRWLLRYWPTPDGFPNRQSPLNTGWLLGPEHMVRGPVLGAVLIDERKEPRAA